MARPFLVTLPYTLTASGTGTVSYQIGMQQQLNIHDIFVASTGTFNITDIRNQLGKSYTNAGATDEIPSSVLLNGGDANNGFSRFPEPLVIAGGGSIIIDLEDSSGSGNTVEILLVCTIND